LVSLWRSADYRKIEITNQKERVEMATLTKPEVCKNPVEGWNVEQIDDDGGCLVTIFTGPDAERRAREYADWQSSRS
jgi:hypothetical protein